MKKVTQRAIAYLKAVLPEDESPSLSLSPEDSPILRLISKELCVSYLVDEGNNYKYIQQRHLDGDDINEAQLHEIGICNLIGVASKRNLRVQPYHHIHAVLMGGDFEASLILLDQLWDNQFRQFVSGEHAVAIPNRDILAFCDSNSTDGVNELRQLITKSYKTGDHPISDKIYIRRQNTWQPTAE